MIDHSPRPGKIQPGKLFLRTAGACELDPERLLEVFGEQRQRFVTVLRGFGPDDWLPDAMRRLVRARRRSPPVRRQCDRDRRRPR